MKDLTRKEVARDSYDADGKRRITAARPASGYPGDPSLVSGYSLHFFVGEEMVCQMDKGEAEDTSVDGYTARYLVEDHLGTTRAEGFLKNGEPTVLRLHDTLPYGVELPTTVSTESRLFTGKMRDSATGMDYFGARDYSGNMGRWTSPDLLIFNDQIMRPQAWNQYQYCSNNPITRLDWNGREDLGPLGAAPQIEDWANSWKLLCTIWDATTFGVTHGMGNFKLGHLNVDMGTVHISCADSKQTGTVGAGSFFNVFKFFPVGGGISYERPLDETTRWGQQGYVDQFENHVETPYTMTSVNLDPNVPNKSKSYLFGPFAYNETTNVWSINFGLAFFLGVEVTINLTQVHSKVVKWAPCEDLPNGDNFYKPPEPFGKE